jgi:pyridoxine 5'-phosphate synthase PdxJ
MVLPGLAAWIEEPDHRAGLRVEGGDAIALVFVAQGTSEPEVLLLSKTAQRLGDDVVDLHRRSDHVFPRQAVPTAVLRRLCHAVPKRLRDI